MDTEKTAIDIGWVNIFEKVQTQQGEKKKKTHYFEIKKEGGLRSEHRKEEGNQSVNQDGSIS